MLPNGWYPDLQRMRPDRPGRQRGLAALEPPNDRSPNPPRLMAGLLLMAQALLIPLTALVTYGAMAGYTPPRERSGISIQSGQLQIVNATCPGERLLQVRMRHLPSTPATERSRLVWSITGDMPLPSTVPVGSTVPGMRAVRPFTEAIDPNGTYSVEVVTNRLDSFVTFTPATLPTIGVEFNDRIFSTEADFRAAAFDLAPCDRHGGERNAAWIGITILTVQVLAFLVGLVMVVEALYQRLSGRLPN